MKGFLLLLLCCLAALGAAAQPAVVPALDFNTLELGRRVVFPAFALFLIGYFILGAIRMVLNYLLKNKIIEATVISPSVVEHLLPGPQDEQRKLVKWMALLFSSGIGLTICSRYLPLGLHSIIILLFSTAFGFLAYYLFLRHQAK
jgi:hypothetical protein